MTQLISKKTSRVLEFLFGTRIPEVMSAMAPFGFTREAQQEGLSLLQEVADTRRTQFGTATPVGPSLLTRMDEYENTWFPIVRGSLARHYPAVGEAFFANLAQSQGRATTVGLLTFISRLEAMAAGEAPYGVDGPNARELLESRGLTAHVLQQAKDLVAELSEAAPATPVKNSAREDAEAELWAWYLEWSAIARVAVKEARLLRQLGFRKRRRSEQEESTSELPETTAEAPRVLSETPLDANGSARQLNAPAATDAKNVRNGEVIAAE